MCMERRHWFPLMSQWGAKHTSAPFYPPLSRAIACHKVLVLGGGDDQRISTLSTLFAKADVDSTNYDPANGQLRDLVDTWAFETLESHTSAGDFMAAIAFPDCITFPQLLGPGGQPHLRAPTGSDRYGMKRDTPANKEKTRIHNIYLLRIARILTMLTERHTPWLLGIPQFHPDLISALHLDQYEALLKLDGVSVTRGVQCAFGALSAKPMTWASYRIPMDDMPSECIHPMRRWHNSSLRHCSTFAKHPPVRGVHQYSKCWPGKSAKSKAADRKRRQTSEPSPPQSNDDFPTS